MSSAPVEQSTSFSKSVKKLLKTDYLNMFLD